MITAIPIPDRLLAGLRRYRDQRIPTGGFLRAVLENDLVEAVGRADEESLISLRTIVYWCYTELPGNAWGSRDRVAAWLANKAEP